MQTALIGTERINTTRNIVIVTREFPPVKVMQTAVIGTKGLLSYRLNLEDFLGNARAYAYFAEIEYFAQNEDSTKGPLLNATEISKYEQIASNQQLLCRLLCTT